MHPSPALWGGPPGEATDPRRRRPLPPSPYGNPNGPHPGRPPGPPRPLPPRLQRIAQEVDYSDDIEESRHIPSRRKPMGGVVPQNPGEYGGHALGAPLLPRGNSPRRGQEYEGFVVPNLDPKAQDETMNLRMGLDDAEGGANTFYSQGVPPELASGAQDPKQLISDSLHPALRSFYAEKDRKAEEASPSGWTGPGPDPRSYEAIIYERVIKPQEEKAMKMRPRKEPDHWSRHPPAARPDEAPSPGSTQTRAGYYSHVPHSQPKMRGMKKAPPTEAEMLDLRRRNQSAAFWSVFVSGFGVSTANKLLTAPFERIKLIIQCQGELMRQERLYTPYGSTLGAMRRVVQTEGFFSLWRGLLPAIFRYFPSQALLLGYSGPIREKLMYDKADGLIKWTTGELESSLALSFLTCVAVYPFDFARTLLACDVKGPELTKGAKLHGTWHVLTETRRVDGLRGIYRGFWPCLAAIVLHQTAYLSTYIPLTYATARFGDLQSVAGSHIALAMVAVNIAALIAYPLDTVRRRMMITAMTGSHYRNALATARFVWRTEGIRGFYRGALLNAGIMSATAGLIHLAQLTAYEDEKEAREQLEANKIDPEELHKSIGGRGLRRPSMGGNGGGRM